MWWKAWIASIVLASGGLWAWAKPADLPVDLRINTAGAPAPTPVPVDKSASPAEFRAAEVYRRAEADRLSGKLTDARRGYEEVHLLAPTSDVGRKAIQRIRELGSPSNEFQEEQEPPLNVPSTGPVNDSARPLTQPKPTREQYQDMLRRTQPLGGVRLPRETY